MVSRLTQANEARVFAKFRRGRPTSQAQVERNLKLAAAQCDKDLANMRVAQRNS